MSNFKIPIYTGICGFIIILFINIIKGNALLVTILRSFFYGALVFGVFFCILFVFKKYLNFNFKADEIKDFKDEEEKPNVDIVVGQDEAKENFIKEEGDNANLFNNIDENRENVKENENDFINQKEAGQEIDSNDIKDDAVNDQTVRKHFEQWNLLGDPSLKIGGYP